MANASGWWREVEEIIERRSLLKHPFYQAWQKGELTLEDLRRYAAAYYPHVAHFPRYVSAVHSLCADADVRRMLLENLIEEERGLNNHPELWLRFAEGVGASRAEVQSAEPTPAARDCVDSFMALARNENPLSGLAALYAYESQIPAVSATKRQGLQSFYGLTDDKTHAFFRVHQEADVWHAEVERAAIERMAKSDADRALVKSSVEAACDAVWRLLDGVMAARPSCATC